MSITQKGQATLAAPILFNCMVKGKGELSAIQEVENDYNMPVVSIIDLSHIMPYLSEIGGHDERLAAMVKYRER